MSTPTQPDTPAQAKLRAEYEKACEEVAAASFDLRNAHARYDVALQRYIIAFGAAQAVGIVK